MFSYYGGKGRIAQWYPAPRYAVVIEPFAGAAWYSIRHQLGKKALLYDVNPIISSTWNWLIKDATPAAISGLPGYVAGWPMERLEPEGRDYYYRFRGNHGSEKPRNYAGARTTNAADTVQVKRLEGIKGWYFKGAPYDAAPDIEATWFIDPPYQQQSRYTYNDVNYAHLAAWVRTRRGQVIVCEAQGADWLPFKPLREAPGQANGKGKLRMEVIWTNDDWLTA